MIKEGNKLDKVKRLVYGIESTKFAIAEMVENAPSRKFADKIFVEVDMQDSDMANEIWDHYVDWKKVKWKDVV